MMPSVEIAIKAQFYDVDPMDVVWHGHYARFFEQARCELLDLIGYNYEQMRESGYFWPIVDMRIKYVRPIRFRQDVLVAATVAEFENRLKIDYLIRDRASAEVLTKGFTIQAAVNAQTGELCFESPAVLIDKMKRIA